MIVLADSDPAEVFSTHLLATVAGIGAAVLVIVAVAVRRGWNLGTTVVASLCSAYVNAGNLGIPVAAYALGDAALVAPTLLLQLLVLQPLALTLLDVDRSPGRLPIGKVLIRPLTNPLTIGTGTGVVLALTDTRLPQPIEDPLDSHRRDGGARDAHCVRRRTASRADPRTRRQAARTGHWSWG